MYNGGKILAGLAIFLGLVTFPFWYHVGSAAYKTPELKLPPKTVATECIESAEHMRAEHMQILNDWRDSVVRNNNRDYVNLKGVSFEMSLQKTCMKCHGTKKDFCDKCHTAAAVSPYCWDCHIAPTEKEG